MNKSIYKVVFDGERGRCTKYISFEPIITDICFFYKDKLNIINLNEAEQQDTILLKEKLKEKGFSKENPRWDIIQIESLGINLLLLHFSSYYGEECFEGLINYDEAIDIVKSKLEVFNSIISKSGYELKLDYIFNMHNDSHITAFYLGDSFLTRIIICIYHEGNCVSSAVLNYNIEDKILTFDTMTNNLYEGLGLNKIIRAVIIITSKDFFEGIKYIKSLATNVVSAYIMIKYFNARLDDEGDTSTFTPENTNLFDKLKERETNSESIDTVIDIYDNFDESKLINLLHKLCKGLVSTKGGSIKMKTKMKKRKRKPRRKKSKSKKRKKKTRSNKKKDQK